MTETLMSERMTAAGVNAPVTRLAVAADKALARSGGDAEKAFAGFSDVVWNDAALLRALIGTAALNAVMKDYLLARKGETAGSIAAVKASEALSPPPPVPARDAAVPWVTESQELVGRRDNSSSGESRGGVQRGPESQVARGPAAIPVQAGGGVHSKVESHCRDGVPNPSEGERVQPVSESHPRRGPSPSDTKRGGVQPAGECQKTVGPAAFAPLAPRNLKDIERFETIAPGTFTLLRKGDGRDIMEMTIGELPTHIWNSAYDTVIQWLIKNYCDENPFIPSGRAVKIRDVIDASLARRMQRFAEGISAKARTVGLEDMKTILELFRRDERKRFGDG